MSARWGRREVFRNLGEDVARLGAVGAVGMIIKLQTTGFVRAHSCTVRPTFHRHPCRGGVGGTRTDSIAERRRRELHLA